MLPSSSHPLSLDDLSFHSVVTSPYSVSFERAINHDWFYTRIYHDGSMIAEKACCRSYSRSVRWARRRIRDHRKALASLEEGV